MTIHSIDLKTGKKTTREWTKEEIDNHENAVKADHEKRSYAHKRSAEYPDFGDAADIAYKQRQKTRMLVGKAREQIAAGDKDGALLTLIEAVEPVDDAKDYDGQVSAVKRKYPKEEK